MLGARPSELNVILIIVAAVKVAYINIMFRQRGVKEHHQRSLGVAPQASRNMQKKKKQDAITESQLCAELGTRPYVLIVIVSIVVLVTVTYRTGSNTEKKSMQNNPPRILIFFNTKKC